MKKDIKRIYQSAVSAVLPENLIENSTFLQTLASKKIHLFGSGKAAVEMVKSMEKIFGKQIIDGLIISPYLDNSLKYVEVYESTHPMLSQQSLDAAQKLMVKLEALQEDELFIYLLSGGSSALIELPMKPLSLDALVETTTLLLQNSVPIEEINIVRKHLSLIKGGRLGARTQAKGLVLVLSDVIGDDLEAIGSAPLYCDTSTFEDALSILDQYGLTDKVPKVVLEILHKAEQESPKKPNENIEHIVLGSNKVALKAAKQFAESLGYRCEIVTDQLQGDVTIAAKTILQAAKESEADCLLFGGECTVEVHGDGQGGRNQELCLHILKNIQQDWAFTFLSGGSDGIDGNSPAAGGIVDFTSYRDDINSYIEKSDSYHYLKRGNDLLVTGYSGTNVMDIMIIIKGEKSV
ncbi:MAG: DUF4147 domain-containing protein [Epsilonproteobacteria bacterium]|nr:DUF4147 domain-containing protein [Campylobacterota bacterium]